MQIVLGGFEGSYFLSAFNGTLNELDVLQEPQTGEMTWKKLVSLKNEKRTDKKEKIEFHINWNEEKPIFVKVEKMEFIFLFKIWTQFTVFWDTLSKNLIQFKKKRKKDMLEMVTATSFLISFVAFSLGGQFQT